jgi:hypothetical protein
MGKFDARHRQLQFQGAQHTSVSAQRVTYTWAPPPPANLTTSTNTAPWKRCVRPSIIHCHHQHGPGDTETTLADPSGGHHLCTGQCDSCGSAEMMMLEPDHRYGPLDIGPDGDGSVLMWIPTACLGGTVTIPPQ